MRRSCTAQWESSRSCCEFCWVVKWCCVTNRNFAATGSASLSVSDGVPFIMMQHDVFSLPHSLFAVTHTVFCPSGVCEPIQMQLISCLVPSAMLYIKLTFPLPALIQGCFKAPWCCYSSSRHSCGNWFRETGCAPKAKGFGTIDVGDDLRPVYIWMPLGWAVCM